MTPSVPAYPAARAFAVSGGAFRAARTVLLLVAGAAPVLSIPLYVAGVLPIHAAAMYLVAPAGLVAVILVACRYPDAFWAARGFVAGIVAVSAYDAMRFPLVFARIWPDFIPRLGGWIVGDGRREILVGYLWRYVGDGGGIGLAFFVACGVFYRRWPRLVTRAPVLLSIGYGIFVWSGLVATIALFDAGPRLLFRLTPETLSLSLAGHLIYGGVLGLYLRRLVPASELATRCSLRSN